MRIRGVRGIAGETKIRRGDGGLAVECSILVDRLASLEEAQNIGGRCQA